MKNTNRNFLFSLVTILAAGSFYACSPASPKLKPEPVINYEKTDLKTDSIEASPLVDILFVVDDSGSMSPHQQNLATNMNVFLNEFLKQKNINFQIGVITTDMWASNRQGRLIGNPRIVTRTTPNLLSVLQTNIKAGSNGDSTELTFDPIEAALNSSLTTTHNAGFLRKDAYLAIIVLADEDDQSTNMKNSAQLMTSLTKLKGAASKVLSYGVISSFPGTFCSDGPGYQPRLESFFRSTVNAVSGKNIMSLCDPDFGLKLVDFSKDLVRYINAEIRLDKAPIISSIRVFFGTQELPSDLKKGWYYDPKINAVILGEEVLLDENQPAGTGIRVVFDAVKFPEQN